MTTIDRIDALDLALPRTPVPRDQDAGGEPSVGSAELFTLPGGVEVGVWEMGVGAMYDVEVDEVFVVLQGVADVEVLDPSGLVSSTLPLRAGSVGRLRAGTRTRWTVQRTLRKIYVVADADAGAVAGAAAAAPALDAAPVAAPALDATAGRESDAGDAAAALDAAAAAAAAAAAPALDATAPGGAAPRTVTQ
jgi:uncharacterized cupin superfamily protein